METRDAAHGTRDAAHGLPLFLRALFSPHGEFWVALSSPSLVFFHLFYFIRTHICDDNSLALRASAFGLGPWAQALITSSPLQLRLQVKPTPILPCPTIAWPVTDRRTDIGHSIDLCYHFMRLSPRSRRQKKWRRRRNQIILLVKRSHVTSSPYSHVTPQIRFTCVSHTKSFWSPGRRHYLFCRLLQGERHIGSTDSVYFRRGELLDMFNFLITDNVVE